MFYLPYYSAEEKKGASGTIITVTEHKNTAEERGSSSEAAQKCDDIVTNPLPSRDSCCDTLDSGKLYYPVGCTY